MTTLLPQPLHPGDTIGFFSPSAPATVFAPRRFKRAKEFLQSKGFKMKAGNLTNCADFYRSGTAQQRAAELNALIRDPEVRCIMSTIGGDNSNALLPYIDYDAIKNDPKIIIGYSDVTALLMGIYAKTGLITFHGPALVASFGESAPLVEETFDGFFSLVCTEETSAGIQPHYPYSMPKVWTDIRIEWEEQTTAKQSYPNSWQFLGSGKVSGRVIGGNVTTLTGIWGSDYFPDIQTGDILLLEDSLKGIPSVERCLVHLKLCGVFQRVAAVILGKYELFDDKGSNRSPLDVLLEILDGYPLPILNNFDSCHSHPMLTLPIGATAAIDFDANTVAIIDSWLTDPSR